MLQCATMSHLKSDLKTRRNFFLILLARQRRCLRDFSVIFGVFYLVFFKFCLTSVLSNGQDVKYDRDITPHPDPFHGINSHEAAKVVHRKWG